MQRQLIGEPITPITEWVDTSRMAPGDPGLPERFIWRGGEIVVAEMLERWKDTGPCHHGSGERYVRKHWFRIRTTDGRVTNPHFERQVSKREAKSRWWWSL